LDGHVVLDRKLTTKGHYPPISILNSLSRVMPMVTTDDHVKQANALRELMAAYYDVEDLVSVGAYKPGTKPVADEAIDKWDRINTLLRQNKTDATSMQDTIDALGYVVNNNV